MTTDQKIIQFKCFICGENGRLVAPGGPDKIPCPKCQKYMKEGIIFISVKENNPDFRTGGWCVIKEEAVRKFAIYTEVLNYICETRICFTPDNLYDKLGLPRVKQDISSNNKQ